MLIIVTNIKLRRIRPLVIRPFGRMTIWSYIIQGDVFIVNLVHIIKGMTCKTI